MDNPGAGVQRHVGPQIHRAQAVIERMAEIDPFQRRALAGGEHRSRQAVAGEAGLPQVAREDEQPALRVHQVVAELRMHIERLVGGAGADTIVLTGSLTSGSIDLAGGNDSLRLSDSGNTISVTNIESVTKAANPDPVPSIRNTCSR